MIEMHPIHHQSSQGLTTITVDEDEGGVDITFHPEPGETGLGHGLTRTLTTAEARALAAMLVHYSFEAEL